MFADICVSYTFVFDFICCSYIHILIILTNSTYLYIYIKLNLFIYKLNASSRATKKDINFETCGFFCIFAVS